MTFTVLLLDEGFMSGAYTALGLRDAGCRVIVLAGTGGRGRYVGRNITFSLAPAPSTAAFLARCDDVVRAEHVDVVYPVTEPIQRVLWDATPRWSDRIVPRIESWQRDLFRDKEKISAFVRERGVPVPASRHVTSDDDAHDAIRTLGLPVVVKGVSGRGGSTTWITGSEGEAMRALRRARDVGVACFFQRYIRGATHLVGGVFDRGRPVRLYAGDKREQYPPRTGPAIRIRSTDDPLLRDTALTLFRVAEVSGIASADFIRDDDGIEGAAGRFLFLELNPRPWGSIVAAAESGVDLFSPLVQLLRGDSPRADLAFRPGIESTIWPLYLASWPFWRSGRVVRAILRDLRGVPGAPWRTPGQAAHLLHRLYRVGRNWPAP